MFLEIPVQEQLKTVLIGTLTILMQLAYCTVKLTYRSTLNVLLIFNFVFSSFCLYSIQPCAMQKE